MVKVCLVHRYLLGCGLALLLCGGVALTVRVANAQSSREDSTPTLVTLRWGTRPGVSRYRLQLAKDATFSDIILDRVIAGNEYRLTELPPGRYYWRVASLNARRGEFSSAGVIQVPPPAATRPSPTPSAASNSSEAPAITSRGGWYSAIGSVEKTISAHLKTANSSEIVAATTDGRVVALDARLGIALWTSRPTNQTGSAANLHLLPVRARSGTENVLILRGTFATLLEGGSGRELWRLSLAGNAATSSGSGTKIFVVERSLRKLFVVDANGGRLLAAAVLPRNVVGSPLALTYRSEPAVMVALDDGSLHVFDETGRLVGKANLGSSATTSPLLVRTARGELVLVGSRGGLTALTADELVPLGRVAMQDDAPRGNLLAEDLDGDGRPEVMVFTDRGKLMLVKSDEGKIIWEADARRAESAAIADLNGDRRLDVLMAGREGFAFALSGRDGSLIWKDEKASNVATNHAPVAAPRDTIALSTVSGILIIVADPHRTGLRAIEFPKR